MPLRESLSEIEIWTGLDKGEAPDTCHGEVPQGLKPSLRWRAKKRAYYALWPGDGFRASRRSDAALHEVFAVT